MYISHRAIDRPRLVIVATILVIVMAIIAGLYIPVQRTPAINTAVVLVMVPYPGSQPTEVEDEITRKIENALQGLDKVDFIQSTSMRGSSVTMVIFLDGVAAKRARDDVAHLVDQVRRELPMGREVQPIITDIDFESAPIMLVNLNGPEGFDERALKQIAEDVQEELEAIPGVANTQLFGGREREIHVNVNPDLVIEYKLTVDDIRRALQAFHAELPAGSTNTGEIDFQIRNETKFRTVEDIEEAVVAHRNGRMIRVCDVATVRDTYRRLKNIALLDGKPTATVIVHKEPNINTLGTAEAIKEQVADLQDQYPHITFSTTQDISSDIRIMFEVLGSSAIFGAMLVLVILAWTMGTRVSMLVLLAIPFSMGIGVIFLFFAGIPMSNIAIFAFILVLGMVVDGAIIVAENIHRHIERGEPPIQAAKTGIDEVGIPVIAADLTTVAAFLPMLLVPGIMGDFLGVLPKVVSVALLGSIVVDHFLIPVLAAYWYRRRRVPQAEPEGLPEPSEVAMPVAAVNPGPKPVAVGNPHPIHPESRVRPNHGLFTRVYGAVLRYSLANRWVVFACCALALVWAGLMFRHIGFVFFPHSDRGQFEIYFELPLGYSVDQTLEASEVLARPLEELKQRGEVLHFVTAVGSSAGLSTRLGSGSVNGPEFGKIMVQLTPPNSGRRHQSEVIEELRTMIDAELGIVRGDGASTEGEPPAVVATNPWPGLTYSVEELQEGPPGGADVAVRLTGKDLDQLGRLGELIEERLERTPGTDEVDKDYRPQSPELVVEPKADVLGLFDLTDLEVARLVQTAILGDTQIQLTMDDEDITLRLQADPEYQKTKEDVERLMVASPSGRRATVGQLARLTRTAGLFSVERYERRRAVTVRCDVQDKVENPDKKRKYIADDVFDELRDKILPDLGFRPVAGDKMSFVGGPATVSEGIRATFTGENEERDENFEYLLRSMIVGAFLILAVLVIQFNSFRQTLVVLMTVPLSFVGVIFGMWVCQHPFSMASFIGLVALTGIVVNDAIVLVDFANQARKRGMPVRQALIEAGLNRFRPVILTTVTTIGGLLPLFLNFSGGAEFWQPLTGAIIFGLAFATVLTLVVIPCAYSLAYKPQDIILPFYRLATAPFRLLLGRSNRT